MTGMSNNKFEALVSSDDSDMDEGSSSSDAQSSIHKALMEVVIPSGEHRLQSAYCIWFYKKVPGKQQFKDYDQNLHLVGTFATCEQFWTLYSHLARPGDLQCKSKFHIFKRGIKPLWEDECNKSGGEWKVHLPKSLTSRCWENLVLAMLGEQFLVGDEICGAVVSIRFQDDTLAIWNRSAHDSAVTTRIRDIFKRVLNLPPGTVPSYKSHKNHSIFRNAEVFVKPEGANK